LPVTGYFLGFLNVFVFVNAFRAPCAGVPMPVNKRQLCTGSRALDTAIN